MTTPVRTARDWRDFLALPTRIYAGDAHHVPEVGREVRRVLDPERNPYFRHADLSLLVTRRNGVPAARAAVVTDRRRLADGLAFFGFFEALDDVVAVQDLFAAAQAQATRAGYPVLEGPYDPNHYSPLGIQVDRFERSPAFFEPHNPPYLPRLLEAAGFAPVKRLHTRRNPDIAATLRTQYGDFGPPRALGGLTVRTFDPRRRKTELQRLREVYEDAFAENWRYLPVSDAEMRFSAHHLDLVTRPEHIVIVEHGREPVAVLQCALDVNPALRRMAGRASPLPLLRFLRERHRIRDLVIVALGVKRAWRRSRAFRLLFEAMRWMARDARALTTTWISPENRIVQNAARRLDLAPDRSIAVYARRKEAHRA